MLTNVSSVCVLGLNSGKEHQTEPDGENAASIHRHKTESKPISLGRSLNLSAYSLARSDCYRYCGVATHPDKIPDFKIEM